MNERPRSIPEMRGMPPIPRDRERPYTPESYAAQYGITVEDAEELVEAYTNHRAIERAIVRMFKAEPSLKDRALFLSADDKPTDEEKRIADRLLRTLGLEPIYGAKEDA